MRIPIRCKGKNTSKIGQVPGLWTMTFLFLIMSHTMFSFLPDPFILTLDAPITDIKFARLP